MLNLFVGWHCYDGHIGGPDRQERIQRVGYIVEKMRKFLEQDSAVGLDGDLIAGGSYSFDLWPDDVARGSRPEVRQIMPFGLTLESHFGQIQKDSTEVVTR